MIVTLLKGLLKRPATGAALRHAPTIIQGAVGLADLLKKRRAADAADADARATGDADEPTDRLESRMDAMDKTSMEQLRLIERLAQQNEALDKEVKQTRRVLTYTFALALLALFAGGLGLLMILNQP